MRLGNILKQKGGTPETGRPVRFQLRQKQKDGKFNRIWAQALMFPVSAAAVSKIQAEVSEFIADNPHCSREDEINLRFIAESLHDSERPALAFCLPDEVPSLASAITVQQIAALLVDYSAMMRSEYPEIWASNDEREAAEEEAADFSEDGQD